MKGSGRRFNYTDAWIFAAVASNHGPGLGTLINVIAAADAIERGIPKARELETSLDRLVQAGFVEDKGDVFDLPDPVYGEYEKVERRSATRWELVHRLLKWLNSQPPRQTHAMDVRISPEAVDEAYRRYVREFTDRGEPGR